MRLVPLVLPLALFACGGAPPPPVARATAAPTPGDDLRPLMLTQ